MVTSHVSDVIKELNEFNSVNIIEDPLKVS